MAGKPKEVEVVAQDGPFPEAEDSWGFVVKAEQVPLVDPDLSEASRASMWAKKVTLCYAAIETIPKDGINKEQGYAYTTVEDIYRAVRKALQSAGLVIIPCMTGEAVVTPSGREGKGKHVLQSLNFNIMDVETGYVRTVSWRGESADAFDKAMSKCVTQGMKTFLRAFFLIPTGEDDADEGSGAETAAPPTGITGGALKAILTAPAYEDFRAMCAKRKLNVEKTVRDAWDAGARTKNALADYVRDLTSNAPATSATLGNVFAALENMGLPKVEVGNKASAVHTKVLKELYGVSGFSELSEKQAQAFLAVLSTDEVETLPAAYLEILRKG